MRPDERLGALFKADRAENRQVVAGTAEYVALRERDRERRREAEVLLAEHPVEDPQTLYAAAWLYNHGEEAAEARRGHELALRAAERGYRPARWLAAAALDRSLIYAGLPQKYGTNIVPDGSGYRLWDVDPATTDDQRVAWDVPPLAEMQARATALNDPMPPLDDAPVWLREALKRWRREA